MSENSDQKILEFPSLIKDSLEFLEASKDTIKNIVCFVELEDGVTFLSTGHDIALLYLITRRLEIEMDHILAEKYDCFEEDEAEI